MSGTEDEALAQSRAAASIGAQVILDFNSDAGLGARGGAGGTVEENQLVRDADLAALGFDPMAPSGPPPSAEVLAARKAEEERLAAAREEMPLPPGTATKMSSLAAGIQEVPELPPDPVEPPP